MTQRLFEAKPLSQPVQPYHSLDPLGPISVIFESKHANLKSRKLIWSNVLFETTVAECRCMCQFIQFMWILIQRVLIDWYLVSHQSTCVSTYWGRVTHICVSKLTTIVSDNGLSPDRRKAIIWTNAGILLIRPLGTKFIQKLIES